LLPAGGQAEVQAGDPKSALVTITEGQGVRAEANGPLSDVVTVNSFPRLDSALDGCPSAIQLTDDVRVNVRLGASRDFPRIGGLGDDTDIQAMGVVASGGWYRIKFKGGFGWIEVRALPLNRACAGLRIFPDNAGPEDVALYSDLTEQAELTATPTN
jgi:hypothetical protein